MQNRRISGVLEGVTEAAETEGKAKRVPAGSLIMSFKLSLGRVAITDRDVFTNEAIACIRPEERVERDFLALALENLNWEILGSRAVKGKTLNADSLDALPVPVPPLPEQRRITDLIGSLDKTIAAADGMVAGISRMRSNLIISLLHRSVSGSRAVRLGDVMSLNLQKVEVEVGKDYPIAGVLNRGRGLLLRESVSAETTNYSRLNRVLPGQVVYSKLKAFEGAVTVAPEDLDKRFASNEFPTFTCGDDLLPEFFRLRTLQPDFWDQLALLSKGMGGRRERLSPDDFLTLDFSLPPIGAQEDAVELVAVVESASSSANHELSALRHLRIELLNALLSGAHRIPETYDDLMGA